MFPFFAFLPELAAAAAPAAAGAAGLAGAAGAAGAAAPLAAAATPAAMEAAAAAGALTPAAAAAAGNAAIPALAAPAAQGAAAAGAGVGAAAPAAAEAAGAAAPAAEAAMQGVAATPGVTAPTATLSQTLAPASQAAAQTAPAATQTAQAAGATQAATQAAPAAQAPKALSQALPQTSTPTDAFKAFMEGPGQTVNKTTPAQAVQGDMGAAQANLPKPVSPEGDMWKEIGMPKLQDRIPPSATEPKPFYRLPSRNLPTQARGATGMRSGMQAANPRETVIRQPGWAKSQARITTKQFYDRIPQKQFYDRIPQGKIQSRVPQAGGRKLPRPVSPEGDMWKEVGTPKFQDRIPTTPARTNLPAVPDTSKPIPRLNIPKKPRLAPYVDKTINDVKRQLGLPVDNPVQMKPIQDRIPVPGSPEAAPVPNPLQEYASNFDKMPVGNIKAPVSTPRAPYLGGGQADVAQQATQAVPKVSANDAMKSLVGGPEPGWQQSIGVPPKKIPVIKPQYGSTYKVPAKPIQEQIPTNVPKVQPSQPVGGGVTAQPQPVPPPQQSTTGAPVQQAPSVENHAVPATRPTPPAQPTTASMKVGSAQSGPTDILAPKVRGGANAFDPSKAGPTFGMRDLNRVLTGVQLMQRRQPRAAGGGGAPPRPARLPSRLQQFAKGLQDTAKVGRKIDVKKYLGG